MIGPDTWKLMPNDTPLTTLLWMYIAGRPEGCCETVVELARNIGCEFPTASSTLHRLQKRGQLRTEVRREPTDTRAMTWRYALKG